MGFREPRCIAQGHAAEKERYKATSLHPPTPFWGRIPSIADTYSFSNRAVLFLLPGNSGWQGIISWFSGFKDTFSTSERSTSALMESMHWGLSLSPVHFPSRGSRSLPDTGCSWARRSLCSTLVSERQNVCCPLKPKQGASSSKEISFNFYYYCDQHQSPPPPIMSSLFFCR